MADFEVKRMTDDDARAGVASPPVGTSGMYMASRRMLGDAGAAAAGKGAWYRTNGLWKTFHLYPQDLLQGTGVGAASVEVHGCMELPEGDEDNAAYVLLATLDSTNLSFSTEEPWRYVRVEVKVPAAFAVQVGLHEQGQ